MNRNQCLWICASSWQACRVHPEDLPQGAYAHLKILLDDTDTTELLMSACERLAQGQDSSGRQERFDGGQVEDFGKTIHGRI